MKPNVEREVDDWGQLALVVLQKAEARAAKVIESSKLSVEDCPIREPFQRLGDLGKCLGVAASLRDRKLTLPADLIACIR